MQAVVKGCQEKPLTDLGRVAHGKVAYEGAEVSLSRHDNFKGFDHEQITHYLSAAKALFDSLFSFWLGSGDVFFLTGQISILVI